MSVGATAALAVAFFLAVVGCGAAQDAPTSRPAPQEGLASCPTSGLRSVANHNPGAAHMLVPPGAVGALVCRYREGMVEEPGQHGVVPQAGHVGEGPALRRLIGAFEALSPAKRGERACPTGFQVHYLVAFHYRQAPDDILHVDYSGCGLATNGRLGTVFEPTGRLRAALDRSVG